MDITRVQYYRTSVLLRIYLGFHIFQEVWLAEFTSREKYIGTAQVVFEGVVLPEVTSRKYVLRMPGFYPRFSFLLFHFPVFEKPPQKTPNKMEKKRRYYR
jgi:hypothetical protein